MILTLIMTHEPTVNYKLEFTTLLVDLTLRA